MFEIEVFSRPQKRGMRSDIGVSGAWAADATWIDGASGNTGAGASVWVGGTKPNEKGANNVTFSNEPDHGMTIVDIPNSELPSGKMLTVAIRPISSLGTKGKAIAVTYSLATKTVRPKRA